MSDSGTLAYPAFASNTTRRCTPSRFGTSASQFSRLASSRMSSSPYGPSSHHASLGVTPLPPAVSLPAASLLQSSPRGESSRSVGTFPLVVRPTRPPSKSSLFAYTWRRCSSGSLCTVSTPDASPRLECSRDLAADDLNPQFWSNKAAHIAAAQLCILPALSAKNNIIGCKCYFVTTRFIFVDALNRSAWPKL
jgi:hypothetical protein